MIYRPLGRTGETISLIGIGGSHLSKPEDEGEATRIVRTAVDRGVTFMDNCWDYSGGKSEERMGKALLDGYRDKVFLMTKIDGRTRAAAAQQIDECLRRLQTDHLDLLQHHEILRMEDPDAVFAKEGSMAAVLDAQKAGKVRFIGFTGTRTRPCICGCWRSPGSTISISTRRRCRSTSWTRSSGRSRGRWCPRW